MQKQIVRNLEETSDRPENEALSVYHRDTADSIPEDVAKYLVSVLDRRSYCLCSVQKR